MSQSDKDPDLSGAIKQLEALLDAQSDSEEQSGDRLPVLDEVVDTDAMDGFDDAFEVDLTSVSPGSTAGPDPEQLRAVLERVAGQMETELENVVGMLKQNMLEEFRNELAAALNIDPQQIKPNTGGQDNPQS